MEAETILTPGHMLFEWWAVISCYAI